MKKILLILFTALTVLSLWAQSAQAQFTEGDPEPPQDSSSSSSSSSDSSSSSSSSSSACLKIGCATNSCTECSSGGFQTCSGTDNCGNPCSETRTCGGSTCYDYTTTCNGNRCESRCCGKYESCPPPACSSNNDCSGGGTTTTSSSSSPGGGCTDCSSSSSSSPGGGCTDCSSSSSAPPSGPTCQQSCYGPEYDTGACSGGLICVGYRYNGGNEIPGICVNPSCQSDADCICSASSSSSSSVPTSSSSLSSSIPPVGAGGRVTVIVTGNGRVTDAAARISCPGDCVESYSAPTSVRLTLTPDAGMSLISVSGCDNITGNRCDVYLGGGRDAYVNVAFTRPAPVCNNNEIQDNGETGVDCGGGGCPDCNTVLRDLTLTAVGPGTIAYNASGNSSASGQVAMNTQTVVPLLNGTLVNLIYTPLPNAQIRTINSNVGCPNGLSCNFTINNPRRWVTAEFTCAPGYVYLPNGTCDTCGNSVCDVEQGETGDSCPGDCRTVVVETSVGDVRYTNEENTCATGYPPLVQGNLTVTADNGTQTYACTPKNGDFECYATAGSTLTIRLNNTTVNGYAPLFANSSNCPDHVATGNAVSVTVGNADMVLPQRIHLQKANSVRFKNTSVVYKGSGVTPYSNLCNTLPTPPNTYENTGIIDRDTRATSAYNRSGRLPMSGKISLKSFRDYKRSKGYNPVDLRRITDASAYKDGAVNIITQPLTSAAADAINANPQAFWNAVLPASNAGRVVYISSPSKELTLPGSMATVGNINNPFALLVEGTLVIPQGVEEIYGIIIANEIRLEGDGNRRGLSVFGNLISENPIVQNRAITYETSPANPNDFMNICNPAVYVNLNYYQYFGVLQLLSTYSYDIRELN